MNSSDVYPTFHFYPKELHQEAERISKKYKNADKVSEQLTAIKLPKLLEQIRALPNNDSVIKKFAEKLKPIDINILATEYPYEQVNKNTIRKIVLILMERYNKIVGRRFWLHFQQLPFDEEISKVLNHCFFVESNNFLGLRGYIRQAYKTIFNSNSILSNLASEIGKERKPLEESFKEWKVAKDSRLAAELWRNILLVFIQEKWFVDTQGSTIIENKLENMPLKDYKQIINQYLAAFDFNAFHDDLLNQVISRLLDPRKNLSRWEGLSQLAVQNVRKWLFKNELFEFLDYERFGYWKKYLRKMTDLKVIEEPPVAAMYFDDFVVLEFGKIGNAAYFYETEGFKKHLAPKLKPHVSVSSLKNIYASFYIHKLSHTHNSWHSRFDDYMSHYLQGHY
ncbi:hypothetical protein BN1058_00878 [Paraliobacillus sp. PM-2]|uniref:hypothetical protein n=1 Tax=Paraliobacillus sp. PM-2 TaxID=1462524 RepID=UPI00061C062B|nr:hypothetical protein [Paraliobacillus sp. PM-2]CQR46609.1 hypothetical protein BN1058_00878 [Paraliobacillus sp. PM-2]